MPIIKVEFIGSPNYRVATVNRVPCVKEFLADPSEQGKAYEVRVVTQNMDANSMQPDAVVRVIEGKG